jgi:hypothetical protein
MLKVLVRVVGAFLLLPHLPPINYAGLV